MMQHVARPPAAIIDPRRIRVLRLPPSRGPAGIAGFDFMVHGRRTPLDTHGLIRPIDDSQNATTTLDLALFRGAWVRSFAFYLVARDPK